MTNNTHVLVTNSKQRVVVSRVTNKPATQRQFQPEVPLSSCDGTACAVGTGSGPDRVLPAFEESDVNWRRVEVHKLEDEDFEDEHVFVFALRAMHL